MGKVRKIAESLAGDIGPGGLAPDAGQVTGLSFTARPVGSSKQEVRVAYAAPDPLGSFSGVIGYLEPEDQSNLPEAPPADGSWVADGSMNAGGEWAPEQLAKKKHVDGEPYTFIIEVTSELKLRVYLNSFNSDGKENALVRASESGATPNLEITLAPTEKGPAGEEYCLNPTAVECEIVYDDPDDESDGVNMYGFRYRITYPDDDRTLGCVPTAIPDDDEATVIPLAKASKDTPATEWQYTSKWPIPRATTFTVWFPGYNDLGENSREPGICPKVTKIPLEHQTPRLNPQNLDPQKIDGDLFFTPGSGGKAGKFTIKLADDQDLGIGVDGLEINGVPLNKAREGTFDPAIFAVDESTDRFKQIAVDLGLPKAGTFDAQLFEPISGVFKLRYSTQFQQTGTGLEVAALSADLIVAGNLKVGNITGAPASVSVYKFNGVSNDLVGWIGHNGSIVGGWLKEFYAGGTGPANATVKVDAAGNATFSGTVTGSIVQGSVVNGTQINSSSVNIGNQNGTTPVNLSVYQWNGFSNQLVAWFGTNGSFYGGWVKEFYIGGTSPADAKIYVNSAGNAVFSGSILANQVAAGGTLAGLKLQINLNGITTSIENASHSSDGQSANSGLKVVNNSDSSQYSAITQIGVWGGGDGNFFGRLTTIFGTSSVAMVGGLNGVVINGSSKTISVNGNAGLSTTVSYEKPGGAPGTLTYTGGVLTSVT